jgi:hypothetical protein
MMYNALMEMHMHSPELVTIRFVGKLGGEENEENRESRLKEEMYGELLLYACFANRLMINWGMNDPRCWEIVERLKRISEDIHKREYVYRYEGQIRAYAGEVGKRRFIAELQYMEGLFKFSLGMKGFGLFDKSILYIGPNSVDVLARFLDERRGRETLYTEYLRKCSGGCSEMGRLRKITMKNQQELARGIVDKAMGRIV